VKGITKMELEVFDGWTIDRRLKQLRKIDKDDKILFVDFDSELGDMILIKKILINELSRIQTDFEKELDFFNEDQKRISAELKEVNEVIEKLEGKQK
jgi:outer membrane translocation and assembly module TamA